MPRTYTVRDRSQDVDGTDAMLGMFMRLVHSKEDQWQTQLIDDPMLHEKIEDEVNAIFKRGAALFMMGLGAKAMNSPSFDKQAEEVRKNYAVKLRRPIERQISVYQMNAYCCLATTNYCRPIRQVVDDPNIPGLDIDLTQFGFSQGVSPNLLSKVSRTFALSHSMKITQQELSRDSLELDPKTIDRIAFQCGKEFLTVRERQLADFRDGTLVCTNEMQGKSISVQIDGGRTRTRIDRPDATDTELLGKCSESLGATKSTDGGRSKRRLKRKSFDAVWREPKLITIYVHDNEGQLVKSTKTIIDGSFADADYMQTLVAMHLKRVGADKAISITFNSDGAKWIWDRIDTILSQAGIPPQVKVYRVLDFFHAAEHISDALTALGLNEKERAAPFNEYRTMLRNNHWQEVVSELKARYAAIPGGLQRESETLFERELRYLESHGEKGHMEYAKYKLMGLPLGSGSIESVIRRVVNLRMKGNSMYWKIDKAESLLALRASIMSDRWDEHRLAAKRAMLKNSKLQLPALVEKVPSRTQTSDTDSKLTNTQ